MRLRDYFGGHRVRLRSPLPARAAAERINGAARSWFWPFSSGVAGGVRSGVVRLRYRSSPFEYNAKPILVGRLNNAAGGCELDLRYRAPAWAYPFFAFWYLFLLAMAAGLALSGYDFRTSGDAPPFALLLPILFLAPVAVHAFGTRRSSEELREMVEFLETHARASPDPASAEAADVRRGGAAR